jgi:hypothetical protein
VSNAVVVNSLAACSSRRIEGIELFSNPLPECVSSFADTVVSESNKNSELIEKAASSQESTTKYQEDDSADSETRNANTNTSERSPAAGSIPVQQQQQAGQRSRGRDRSSQDSGGGWTPHRRLNFIVYIILVSGAFLVLDREYGGILTVWLRMHFPREAATLGFKVHRGV